MKSASQALIIMLTFAAVGCSSVNNVDQLTTEEASALTNKTVAIPKYKELPDFAAQTAANVQFGLLGVAAAISSGNAMIKNNKIGDPAIAISDKLGKELTVTHKMRVTHDANELSVKATDDELTKVYGKYDYILDVKTLGWGSIYFASDWNNYRVNYTARARLIDVKSGQVIAEETCTHVPDYQDTNTAPTYQSLENGSGLSDSLNKSVDYCVNQIQTMANLHAQTKSDVTTQ